MSDEIKYHLTEEDREHLKKVYDDKVSEKRKLLRMFFGKRTMFITITIFYILVIAGILIFKSSKGPSRKALWGKILVRAVALKGVKGTTIHLFVENVSKEQWYVRRGEIIARIYDSNGREIGDISSPSLKGLNPNEQTTFTTTITNTDSEFTLKPVDPKMKPIKVVVE